MSAAASARKRSGRAHQRRLSRRPDSGAVERRRAGLGSIGIDYRGDGFRLSLDGGYQSQYTSGGVGYVSVAPGALVPGVPDLNNNFILPWTFTTAQDLFGALRAEVDVWPGVTLYGAIGAHDNRWASLWSGDPIVNNLNGPGSATQTPLYNTSYETKWTSEIGLRGEASTGPVDHTFAVSAMRYQQVFGFGRGIGTAYASNIYSPNVIARPNITTMTPQKSSALQLTSLAIADTLSFAEKRVQLTLGARYQQIVGENFDLVSGNRTSATPRTRSAPRWRWSCGRGRRCRSTATSSRASQPGTVVGADLRQCRPDLRALPVDAVRGRHQDRLGQVHHDAQRLPDQPAQRPSPTPRPTRSRRTACSAIAASSSTCSARRPRACGCWAVRCSRKRSWLSTQGGVNDGWQAAGAPNVQVNLAGEWDTPFAPGLTLDGRVIYTSSQYVGLTKSAAQHSGLGALRHRRALRDGRREEPDRQAGGDALQCREPARHQLLVDGVLQHAPQRRHAPHVPVGLDR